MAARHLRKRLTAGRRRRRDRRRSTFTEDGAPAALNRYVSLPDPAVLEERAAAIRFAADMYVDHRFDLLGSGWVQVRHGMDCNGVEGSVYPPRNNGPGTVENSANRRIGEMIAARLPGRYQRIDWHLDFKSGFRWSENAWHQDIDYGHLPGVDIKVPWELARMQHLPTLVWAHVLAARGGEGFRNCQIYADEIIRQITDFIAHNPPRFGVNWSGSMDVAIRAANWAVSIDCLRAAGAEIDREFETILRRSLADHGRHVFENLEWDPDYRANHYLANIVGLLFISAYLPKDAETDRWLEFSIRELANEILRQFNADGSGFEASTAYHRLAAEMAVYGLALAHAVDQERRRSLGPITSIFGPEHFTRLRRAADFARRIIKPSGRAAQIGDNDSGRFMKFAPAFHPVLTSDGEAGPADPGERSDAGLRWTENHLDFRHLLGAADGLFAAAPDTSGTPEYRLEYEMVRGLAGGPLDGPEAAAARPAANLPPPPALPEGTCVLDDEFRVPGPAITAGLRTAAFPDFGLYIFFSERLFLAVRCGPIGLNGRGAHAHNDQLALELEIDGEDWIADPGSYLYSAAAEQRDAYRSVDAHFAPKPFDREPGNLGLGMFWLGDEARAECDGFSADGFLGHHYGFGAPVYRQVTLGENEIRVRDTIIAPATPAVPRVLEGRAAVRRAVRPAVPFSPGYGLQNDD